MKANEVTLILIGCVLAAAGLYDLVAAVVYGYEATITSVIRDISSTHSVVPFAAGALVAHLLGW